MKRYLKAAAMPIVLVLCLGTVAGIAMLDLGMWIVKVLIVGLIAVYALLKELFKKMKWQ